MTKSEQDFLNILGNVIHPMNSFTLDAPDWDKIYLIAKKQNLFPLIFDASESLRDFDAADEKYFIQATRAVSTQMQRTVAFLELYKRFLSSDLSPIVVKGIVCRSLYGEKGDFRVSGDEDILIEKKDFDRIAAVLKECGYETGEKPDNGMEIVQEVTFRSEQTGLTVEVHLNPFSVDNKTRVKMNEQFMDVFDSDEYLVVNNVAIHTMKATDHMLYLIFHDYMHFTGGGFGVRLMTDTLLFAEKFYECIDWEQIDRVLEDTGIAPVYADMVSLGNRYLGFTLPENRVEICPDEMLEDMLEMGTFGNSTNAGATAWALVGNFVREAGDVEQRGMKGGRFKSIFHYLFPTWKTWKAWRPYLKDKPWMLPAEWCKRVGRYLRKETPTHNLSEINESYEMAEHRLELLKKYNIL